VRRRRCNWRIQGSLLVVVGQVEGFLIIQVVVVVISLFNHVNLTNNSGANFEKYALLVGLTSVLHTKKNISLYYGTILQWINSNLQPVSIVLA